MNDPNPTRAQYEPGADIRAGARSLLTRDYRAAYARLRATQRRRAIARRGAA